MSFKPDYGSRRLKEGVTPSVDIFFQTLQLYSLSILAEGQYSTTGELSYAGEPHTLSLDFNDFQLAQILARAPEQTYQTVMAELARDPNTPRTIELEGGATFGVRARLGEVQVAQREQFVPLVVQDVL